MITAIGGIKGGVGKSTTAINLAVQLAHLSNSSVFLVDADDQGTTTDFNNLRNELHPDKPAFTFAQLSDQAVRTESTKLSKKFDHIIIDAGGRDTVSQRAALSVANLFIVPCEAKSFGIWTLQQLEGLISRAREFNPTLEAYSYINMAWTNAPDITKITDNLETAQILAESEVLKYSGLMLGNRKSFSNAGAEGLGVIELPRNKSTEKAQEEFVTLFQRFYKVDLKSKLEAVGA
ncbi:AAA family ATPase [Endozoicomonas sp. SM1973]|uniref:AAA family ATPase n=1 Tax=Spartinivicinus marinus TaxID=2994442 RepID=A0A853IGL3_9GAMM|nr:AAA family ATPase [Spartinivicinus marinus]NYZ69678.1 AAA family ATPase [Spartinivicinus marinus]